MKNDQIASNDFEHPRPPVLLDEAFDDPDQIRKLVRRNGPYWPTMRYVANAGELRAVGGEGTPSVIPWFREDWAYGEPLVDGGAEILANKRFVEAAHTLFDAEIVRPLIVYVNVMGPMAAGPAHIDVPAFRGIDRTEYPVTLLHLMHRSGLFEAQRVSIATAVAWFYEGERGEFEYWADGISRPPRRIDAPLSNRAVVGDNEVMFHRVAPIGGPMPAKIENASLDVELRPSKEGSDWCAVDHGRELIRYREDEIRVSISWKAEVFADQAAAQIRTDHSDDLSIEGVISRLLEDLDRRDVHLTPAQDAVHDPEFIRALNETYPLPTPKG